jgi:hypothetical protein
LAGQSVQLKTDFREAPTPSFQPSLKLCALRSVSIRYEDQINVTAYAGVARFGAAEQIDRIYAEAHRIKGGSNALLSPAWLGQPRRA